ncbi:hypothetical protein FRC16_009411 [Serendipita sp. 398]|nr:hypothetical protein FRC16_009411 [Serendipita sp. 398]
MAPPTESEARTPRSPTVSVTMTPAQSFHPSFRDDLSTVPSEEEQTLATASAPMKIITHDVNRLLEYLDGVDRQRVAEHGDVKDQLDRVEDELKRLTDFVRKEAAKSPPRPVIIPVPSPPLSPLPDLTEDVVILHAPRPAVILLDPPASPLRLSSGSVTESIQWLSSPSSISEGLPIPFQESTRSASSVIPSSMTKSVSLHSSGASADHSLGPLDSISQRSELLGKSDTQSERSLPLELSGSEGLVPLGPSEVGSQRSASLRPSDSASQRLESLAPSDPASHLPVSRQLSGLARSASPGSELSRTLSVEQSESGVISHSPSSPLHDVMSISSEQESGTPESTNILLAPPPSAGSTSPANTSIDPNPPRTRGNTPDIDIVSASGRGSPARSDITLRQGVSNAQLRDMLNDLRRQTDKLMDQQNKTNDAIEELQNRPPIQLPALPPSQPTPRRSRYADLLLQITDTLRDIVEAGEAARELPLESDATETETESIAEIEDTGATLQLNNLLQQYPQEAFGLKVNACEFITKPRNRTDHPKIEALVKRNRAFRGRDYQSDIDDEGAGDLVQMFRHHCILSEQKLSMARSPFAHRWSTKHVVPPAIAFAATMCCHILDGTEDLSNPMTSVVYYDDTLRKLINLRNQNPNAYDSLMGYYNRALEFVKEEEVDEFSDEEERETWRRLQMRPNGPYSIIPCANLISKL